MRDDKRQRNYGRLYDHAFQNETFRQGVRAWRNLSAHRPRHVARAPI